MSVENPDEGQPQQPELKDQQPQAPQEHEAARAIPALIDAYKTEQEANRKQEANEDFWRRWRELATLAFIVATTAGVFIQAWVLHTTDEAIHTSANSAKTAADAATKAADAATKSADTATKAIDTNVASERARLLVGGMTIKRANEQDLNPTISSKVINIGRTSALVTGVSIECAVADLPTIGSTPVYNQQLFRHAMSLANAGNEIPMPGSDCGLDKPITTDELVALSVKTKIILFKGFIVYQDVFGEKFTQRFAYYSYGDKVDAFYPLTGLDAYSAEIKDPDRISPRL